MADILYQKYLNIQKFILDYRKYQVVGGKFLDQNTFNKSMLNDHYVKIECTNTEDKIKVYIILLKNDSKYLKSTPIFKKLMMSLGKNSAEVIIISKELLSIYIKKIIPKLKHLTIQNYLHRHFSIEIPKGPLCSKHRILTSDEVSHLCSNDLMIHPLGLPTILINDPQCIWLGAKIGDTIEIESLSEISGKAVRYRIVRPAAEINENLSDDVTEI
jgi:DNA-directed RNA polymerase subunit H (RpoH/RPB5)